MKGETTRIEKYSTLYILKCFDYTSNPDLVKHDSCIQSEEKERWSDYQKT